MRLVSFIDSGRANAGVLLANDTVLPLAAAAPALPNQVRALLAGNHLAELAFLVEKHAGPGVPLKQLRLIAPIPDAGKIICIGLNYKDHAIEQNKPWPEQPLLFSKTGNTLSGPYDDIRLPAEECSPDYEVELAVVIGARATRVAREEALACVGGYMVGNDVSARKWQRSDGQWFRAKSCDSFYPCGPWLTTADDVADPHALRLSTTVNGEVLQDARTDQLIHDVPALISYISRHITLEPGDIISTGTPAGVGCFRTPPRFLRAGDVVECAIDGLGVLRNRVAGE
jgi:2-keto-4-pentenoate hydratase/2-oxohepta-3-ene-1,7-dioic acid hydratase in catechol pathway